MVFHFGIRLAILSAFVAPTQPCNMMSMEESCSERERLIVKSIFIHNIVFEGDITDVCRRRWEAFNCAYQDEGVFLEGCDATEVAEIHGNKNVTGVICDQYHNEFIESRDCFASSNKTIDTDCILPWEDAKDDCNSMLAARECAIAEVKRSCDVGGSRLMAHVLNGYFRPFADAYGCDDIVDLLAPEIFLPNTRIGQFRGSETILECTVTAFPRAVIDWMKNGTLLSGNDKYSLDVYHEGYHRHTLSLRVNDIDTDAYGAYTCVASNTVGKAQATMYLYDLGSRPRNITAGAVSATTHVATVIVHWEEPEFTNGVLTGYKVYYTEDPSQPMLFWDHQDVQANLMATITDLKANATYFITVVGVSAMGEGSRSRPIQVLTGQGENQDENDTEYDATDDVTGGSGNREEGSERLDGSGVNAERSRAGHSSSDHVHISVVYTVGLALGCVILRRFRL